MPVVKINAIEVPPDAGPELEKRFAHRAHAVDNQPGFLGFQLLRPVKGEDRYFVVTQWESEEAFQAWASVRPSKRTPASARTPSPPERRYWSSRLCWTLRGLTPSPDASRARRWATTITVAVTLVVALACGCADAGPAAPAEAAQGTRIDTNTPQGLRAKQVMDMLNSDWPIGPVGVRTLAAPDEVDDVGTKMDKIWWDRPFTLTGVDIGAGHATLRVLTSYQVAQDIKLRTNDAASSTGSTCRCARQ